MSNYNKYSQGHWSTESDVKKSLDRYLNMYEDIYNKTNLSRILSVIQKDKQLKICDYGGGVGIVAIELAKKGHSVTLVDASSDALQAATYYAQKENVNITTHCATTLDQGLYADHFDIIVSKDLIEHIDDDSSLIMNFYSSLKKEGSLILTTQNSNSFNYVLEGGLRKILHPTVKWMGWDRTYVRFYTPRMLNLITKKVGFSSSQFNSGYIFPYKLISMLFPWVNPRQPSFLFSIDKFCMKRKMLRKLGWNIMAISKK